MTGGIMAVLAFLATARVTRFVNADTLARPLRAWLIGRFHPHVDPCRAGADSAHSWKYYAEHEVFTCADCGGTWTTKLRELFDCPWCLSVWVSAVVTALGFTAAGLWDGDAWFAYPATVLGISWLYGLVAQHLDK